MHGTIPAIIYGLDRIDHEIQPYHHRPSWVELVPHVFYHLSKRRKTGTTNMRIAMIAHYQFQSLAIRIYGPQRATRRIECALFEFNGKLWWFTVIHTHTVLHNLLSQITHIHFLQMNVIVVLMKCKLTNIGWQCSQRTVKANKQKINCHRQFSELQPTSTVEIAFT